MQNAKSKLVQWLTLESNLTKTSSKTMLLTAAILIYFAAQSIAWLQLNGQFVWPWMKEHPFLLSLLGVPISYLLMLATNLAFQALQGQVWPGRLLAFAVGIVVFTVFTNVFLGEGFTIKTIISLILTAIIMALQLS
jgi:hypothetical protein